MEGETTTGAIALESTVHIPIADLSPDIPAISTRSIKAVVTLTWPYSSATGSVAFLLSEPDFRLRRAKGQVRVQLFGSSAKAAKEFGIASGDELVLCLDGVEWVPNDPNAVAPGMGIEWELRFTERLLLEFKEEDTGRVKNIDIDHPPTPEEIPAPDQVSTSGPINPTSPTNNTISVTQSLGTSDDNLWSSPAFLKRSRTSYGSMFETNYDPFAEDDSSVRGMGRKRSRINSTAWRYTSQSPTPEAEEAEVNTTATSPESPQKPAPTMTDEACQTVDFGDKGATEDLARTLADSPRQHTNVGSVTYSTDAEPIFLDQVQMQVDDSVQSNCDKLPRLPSIHTQTLDLEVEEEARLSPRIPSSPRLQAVPSDALSLVSPLLSTKHSHFHQNGQPPEDPQESNGGPEAISADGSFSAAAKPGEEDIYGASPADRRPKDPEPELLGFGNSRASTNKIRISAPKFEDKYASEDQYGHWQSAEAQLSYVTSPTRGEIFTTETYGDRFYGIREEAQQSENGHTEISAEMPHSEYPSLDDGMLGQVTSAWGISSVAYPDPPEPESSAKPPSHSTAMPRSQSELSATSAVVDLTESVHEPEQPLEESEDDLNVSGDVEEEENEMFARLQHFTGQRYDLGVDDDDDPEDFDGSQYSADYEEDGFQPKSPSRKSQETTSSPRPDEKQSDEGSTGRNDITLEDEVSVPYGEQADLKTSVAGHFEAENGHYDAKHDVMDRGYEAEEEEEEDDDDDDDEDRDVTVVKDDNIKAQKDHNDEAEDKDGYAQAQDDNQDIEIAQENLLVAVVVEAEEKDGAAQAIEQDQNIEDEKMHSHETEMPSTVGSVHDGYESGNQDNRDLDPDLQAHVDEQGNIPEEAKEVQTPETGQDSIALELQSPVKPAVEQFPHLPEISPRPSLFSRMFDGANDEPQFGASYTTSLSRDEAGPSPSTFFRGVISHFSDGLTSNQVNSQLPTPDETQNSKIAVSTEASFSYVPEHQQLSDKDNDEMDLDQSDELLLNEGTEAAVSSSSPVKEAQTMSEPATVQEERIEVEEIQTSTIKIEKHNEEIVDYEQFNTVDDSQLEMAMAKQEDIEKSRHFTDTEVTETEVITETTSISVGVLKSSTSDGSKSYDSVADSNVDENEEEEDAAIGEPESSFDSLRRSARSAKPAHEVTANVEGKIHPGTSARASTLSDNTKKNVNSASPYQSAIGSPESAKENTLPLTPAKPHRQPLSNADVDGLSPMVVIDTRASPKGHDASIEFALEANDSSSPPRHNPRKPYAATEAIKLSLSQHNLRKQPPATIEAADSSPPQQHNLRNRTISVHEAVKSCPPPQHNLRSAHLSTSEVASSSPPQHDVQKAGVIDTKMRLLRALRTDLTQFSTLKVLKFQINKKLDFLAMVTTAPPDPVRAKKGPRQYQITFNITDPSIAPAHVVEVQVFRPYKAALPMVEPGDGILLRNFQVMSVQSRGGFALRSTQDEASSWAVFKRHNGEVDVRGPPVEYGDGEKNHVAQLKSWYEALDETALAKIARANGN
ncbi:3-dehydroshikimate dehydratase [Diplocarpon rosae]|nr:3-dehydroshikimate dehydratase [Diplocarpon rosae]